MARTIDATYALSAFLVMPSLSAGSEEATTTTVTSPDDVKPVTPAEAATMVGKKVTVAFYVKSIGKTEGLAFLNSEASHKNEKNFTIFIGKEGMKKFREAEIDDPAAFYRDKTIRVIGTVTTHEKRP